MVTEATILQMAIQSVFSNDARKQFSKLLKSLNVELGPIRSKFGETELTPEMQAGPSKDGKTKLPDFVKGVPILDEQERQDGET